MKKIKIDKDTLIAFGAMVLPVVGGILGALKSKSDIDKSVANYLDKKQNS